MNILCCWNSITSFFFTKLLIILLLLILNNPDFCLAQDELKDIAVLEFQDNSIIKNQEIQKLRSGLPSLFMNALSTINNVQIIDRRKLKKILEEQALIQSGILKEDSFLKIGKLTGANFLILGSFLIGMNEDIRIDCRIVDSESGEIIKAEEVNGKTDDFFELAQNLTFKLLDDLDIKINKEEANTIQLSLKGCSFQNMISYSLALTEIDLGNKKNAKEILQSVISECSEFSIAKELLEEIQLDEKNGF